MPAHVELVLDTTAPVLTGSLVEDGSGGATLTLASTEEHEVKVWGEIDVTWPGNADYGETEAEAEWIPFAASLELRLDPGGAKRIYVRARDDVHNASDVLQVSGEPAPPPPIPPRQVGFREPVPSQVVHVVAFPPSKLELSSGSTRVETRAPSSPPSYLRFDEMAMVRAWPDATRSKMRVEEFASTTAQVVVGGSWSSYEEHAVVHKRSEGPNTEAALAELDII